MKQIIALAAFLVSAPAFAVTFTGAGTPGSFNAGTGYNSANGTAVSLSSSAYKEWQDNSGITVDAFTYSIFGGGYVASQLWLREDGAADQGFGVCSSGESCGPAAGPGNGDYNELSDNKNFEIIRLSKPSNKVWSDLSVSSMDSNNGTGSEKGTLYWSNSATPTTAASFDGHYAFSYPTCSDCNLWSAMGSSLRATVSSYTYLFFTAGSSWKFGKASSYYNNDYLVDGASVTSPSVISVPEPETYAMILAGLGLMGYVARRRKAKQAAA